MNSDEGSRPDIECGRTFPGGGPGMITLTTLARTAFAVVLLATAAQAAPTSERDATGFEASIVVGPGTFAGATAWAPGERTASVGVHGFLAYRFSGPVDLGVHVFNQWLAVRGLSAGSTAVTWAAAGGLMMRVHPLSLLHITRVDLSLGVGLDFFQYARQTTQGDDAGPSGLQTDAVSGAAVPVVLGLDLVVTRLFAVGVIALWSPWWHTEACSSQGTAAAACEGRVSPPVHYLFLGLGVRLHLRFAE